MATFPLKPRLDVAINYVASGIFCTTTHHYSAPAVAPTAAQMQTAADGLSTRFADPYKAFLSLGNEFLGVEVRYLSATHGRYATSTVGAGAGTSGSAETMTDDLRLPSGDCAVITLEGDGPPRKAQSTKFISGINEGDTDGSRLITASLEECQDIGLALLVDNTFPGVEGVACTLSRSAALLYELVSMRVNPILGHLRRRRPAR